MKRSDNDRYPLLGVHPPKDARPAWLCWLIVIAQTFGLLIAVLWLALSFVQPRIIDAIRMVP